ncbi:YolD-like family protein [Pontibacillus yanchengensis]|uniref:YolD-like family protein n=2 Tax=Pontibacillus yanchengensis TaxID=462910 RepID=A0ACC7VFA1_9BACI|nr:YolD-like family protein [Pontibacillus yanchengensis]MYL32311.1 YolD-like family protein [Pontibacillus yanchengensis]MYL52891.1 YolD-like family protein [Pontibacillus yanchengensis]
MTRERINDRGTIKWTSMMLPEHVEKLKEMWREDERVEKGDLDEQQAAEIDFKLQLALKDDLTVGISYHNGFDYRYAKVKILSIIHEKKTLYVVNQESKDKVEVSLHAINEVTII